MAEEEAEATLQRVCLGSKTTTMSGNCSNSPKLGIDLIDREARGSYQQENKK
jgi:hypothetical protein